METSVITHSTIQPHIPQVVSNPHLHRSENLKTRTINSVSVTTMMGDKHFYEEQTREHSQSLRVSSRCTSHSRLLYIPVGIQPFTTAPFFRAPYHIQTTNDSLNKSLKKLTITHNDTVMRRNCHAVNELAKGQHDT